MRFEMEDYEAIVARVEAAAVPLTELIREVHDKVPPLADRALALLAEVVAIATKVASLGS
jgi:hypothetical protein